MTGSLSRTSFFTLAMTLILSLGALSSANIAQAGEDIQRTAQPHINIAIFHKLLGQESFSYPAHVSSQDILNVMADKAQFIAINHTAGIKDGDVVTLANDVLRDDAGEFEDFGVDCQMTIHLAEQHVTVSGICEILMMDQDGRTIEHKGMLMPTPIDTGKDWILIYHDKKDGIAVYVDVNIPTKS